MFSSRGTIQSFGLTVSALVLLLSFGLPAVAGEPTKGEAIQPGAEGAATVRAEEYASLQAAIDALPEGGGKIAIPAGRFEVLEPLTLSRGDVMIQGAGSATHIVNRNETGKAALVIQPPEGVKSIWRVQIADLRVTGNPKSGAGIYAKSVDEILISRVASEHNGTDGILLDNCYEDARVCDSLMNYNKNVGLNLLGCHDIVVSANQFEENMDAVHCIDGYNLTMTGNNVDDHLGNGVVVANTYGSVVSGNMIEECNGHAVVLRGECYGDTLSANTFAHCKGAGARIEGARCITISANTFVLLAEPAVHALPGAGQLTITGNTFNRYPFDPSKRHKLDPGQGILLESAKDVTINGNSFVLTAKAAIRTSGRDNMRINITGNTILNPSQDERGTHPGMYLENLTKSIIANNIVTDDQDWRTMKQPIIFSGAVESNIVTGNILDGQDDSGLPAGGRPASGNIR